ncbi:MAG: hypothetical protein IH985_07060 [Planctomycetes bacterium]|nr:hypothetical protein [Planctomycetota bacterium]
MSSIINASLDPPPWVFRLISHDGVEREIHRSRSDTDLVLKRHCSPSAALITATVPHGNSLSAGAFRQITCEAYSAIHALIPKGCHPVRFWNYIPSIHAHMDDRLDRYMVFNLGRQSALSERYGGLHAIAHLVPTSTGVGHDGSAFVIHCLALTSQPEHVENPRQVSAYHYSNLYGPASPSFSRATLVTFPGMDSRSLIIGGTASVRGEATVAPYDLWSQFDETLENLEALLVRAYGEAADLSCFESVRAYYARVCDELPIRQALRETFIGVSELELIQAEICRRPLLIEIEGVARSPESIA